LLNADTRSVIVAKELPKSVQVSVDPQLFEGTEHGRC
jgi:hypothetical protein